MTELTNTPPASTVEEARARVVRVRTHLEDVKVELLEARRRKDWQVLGYRSWIEYGRAEYAGTIAIPREDEDDLVLTLHNAGLSLREIAAPTGISKSKIGRIITPPAVPKGTADEVDVLGPIDELRGILDAQKGVASTDTPSGDQAVIPTSKPETNIVYLPTRFAAATPATPAPPVPEPVETPAPDPDYDERDDWGRPEYLTAWKAGVEKVLADPPELYQRGRLILWDRPAHGVVRAKRGIDILLHAGLATDPDTGIDDGIQAGLMLAALPMADRMQPSWVNEFLDEIDDRLDRLSYLRAKVAEHIAGRAPDIKARVAGIEAELDRQEGQ